MTHHALVLTDRGRVHRHRWAPSCSCGTWVGVFRRRKQEAVAQHRRHVAIELLLAKGDATRPAPQPLTPTDSLPEALR